MSAAVSEKGTIRGWHVLAALVGFFLTVTAVDVIMITKAVSTFSGDTADAYRKGLAYNQTLEQEAIQDKLGWHESRSFDSATGRLSISVTDENKTPVDGLDLQADGGTHVANTREIGVIRIVGYESKGKINKRLRIALE